MLGLLYAVIALGYTMVYGVLGLINFAHAEIFMVGGVVGIEVLIFGTAGTGLHPMLQLMIAVAAAMLVSASLALATERIAYRPLRLRGAPRLVPLITAIGMSLFLQDAVRFIESLFGNYIRPFPGFEFFSRSIELTESVIVSYKSATVVVVAVIMLAGLTYLVNYTRLGRAIRAVAQDPKAAALMGIDVNRMVARTFLIGGALAGVAGVLWGLQFGKMDPFSGFIPGIKAFTAAVLGGIGNIPGAMLGGVLLGLLEVLAGTYLPLLTNDAIGNEYKDIFAFSILILILIFRPSGLLGRPTVEKV